MSDETKQEILLHIDNVISSHVQEENTRYTELKTEIENLRTDMAAFVEAWQQAKGVIYAVKWLASIAGGVTALILFFKDHVK